MEKVWQYNEAMRLRFLISSLSFSGARKSQKHRHDNILRLRFHFPNLRRGEKVPGEGIYESGERKGEGKEVEEWRGEGNIKEEEEEEEEGEVEEEEQDSGKK
ncbi:hypothetical protein M8J77_006357 [Diaphorina citri]|nr:hypothetical protein M8J77_006357 [Diaphorina citri]